MNYKEIYKDKDFGDIFFDEPMKYHTSFGIGGKADIFVMPSNEKQIQKLINFNYRNNIKTTIIGNGSNLLVSDKGIRGCVVCLSKNFSKLKILDDTKLYCLSGSLLNEAAKFSIKHSLSGMEEISGIPGSIGGAVAMNAGAYGGEIKDIAISVRLMDFKGNIFDFKNDQMNFSYRHSKVFEDDYIVISAIFQLRKGDKKEIQAKYDDYTNRRKTKQPLEKKSAGSTFKRPKGSYASKLIDQTGLRGFRRGDCQVSEKHCGFIINDGDATCEQMLNFIDEVKNRVYENTGFKLEREVKLVGEF